MSTTTNNQQEMINALIQALTSSQKEVAELRNEIMSGSKRHAASVDDETAAAAAAADVPEGKTKKSKKEPKKEPKPPKAATPYNLYVKEQSVLVKAGPGEMMRVIANQWNALGAEGKKSYVDAAKAAKDSMTPAAV